MPHRPEPVPPLTPDQVAAILGAARSAAHEPDAAPPTRATAIGRSDPEFEARSRRDTRLANELFDRLREVREIVAAAPLDPAAGDRARAALGQFEHALLDLLRYHGT
jgi:hypothetical protein